MIDEQTRAKIMRLIAACEQEHKVKIVYAVESGSRAWGFPSPNSDFDVRFIYIHQKNWYLSINLETKKDTIEYPIVDEIDLSGWDIRKALKLFLNSNPTFIEWIQSPIVYVDDGFFVSNIKKLMPEIYSFAKGIYHYRSMATGNFSNNLQQEKVLLKKYFYTLRPLLAAKWLQKHQSPAPLEFDELKNLLPKDDALLKEVNLLLERKKTSLEKEKISANRVLDKFICEELEQLAKFAEKPQVKHMSTKLDQLFQKLLEKSFTDL